jgi:hypothetical protein
VKSRHAELVLDAAAETSMQVHDFVLIAKFLSKLEEKTHLERAVLDTLFSLGLGFAVLSQGVQTASLVNIDLLVLFSALDQFIVNCHRFPTGAAMGMSKVTKETG